MKRLLQNLLALALLLTCGSYSLNAQDDSYIILNYSPAIPMGNVADFSGDFSWRGFELDTRFFINENVSMGIQSGWNVFREESDGVVTQSFENDEGVLTLSGKRFRFTNCIPILATAHYHLGEEGDVRPYIGLGVGAYYIEKRVEMGLYEVNTSKTHFGLSPSLGIVIPGYSDGVVHLGVQYHSAFASGDYDGVNSLAFNIGLGWPLY